MFLSFVFVFAHASSTNQVTTLHKWNRTPWSKLRSSPACLAASSERWANCIRGQMFAALVIEVLSHHYPSPSPSTQSRKNVFYFSNVSQFVLFQNLFFLCWLHHFLLRRFFWRFLWILWNSTTIFVLIRHFPAPKIDMVWLYYSIQLYHSDVCHTTNINSFSK